MSLIEQTPRIAVFDTETDGIDVERCHIVTASFMVMDTSTGAPLEEWSWIIDNGIEIPVEASDIHGVTTARARAEGRRDVSVALFEIAGLLDHASMLGIPVAIQNASFDLTLLDRCLRRQVGFEAFRPPQYVFDGFVVDKAIDRFRKGKRTLSATAEHYGIPVKDAHDARADCIMAGRLAIRLLNDPRLKGIDDWGVLMEKQQIAKREQSESLAAYFRRAGKSEAADSVDSHWPMRPWQG